MKVYALVGKSGTGKSFQAMNLCKKLNIDSIIDDGLFIYNNKVICGDSAKKEKTKVGATKAALFLKGDRAKIAKEKIKEYDPQRILVLGTSVGMVDKIVKNIGLPKIDDYISIEEITSQDERDTAHKQRYQQGKHVIPASTIQVKKDFAGYFIHPILRFKDAASKVVTPGAGEDRTVVRPTYSYLGNYFITSNAVKDIVKCVGRNAFGISKILSIYENADSEAMVISVVVACNSSENMWSNILGFQEDVKENVEKMTAFNVASVDVEVKELVY